MIVLITGMPRSGSTWTFNVVRFLLSRADHRVYWEATDEFAELVRENAPRYDHLIFKTHQSDAFGSNLIRDGRCRAVCSYRDPVDALASWMEMFDIDLEPAVARMINHLRFVREQKADALMVDYVEIKAHAAATARRIAAFLGEAITPLESRWLALRLSRTWVRWRYRFLKSGGLGVRDVGFSHYDERTLFHHRHIKRLRSTNGRTAFSKAEIAYIRHEMREFIDDELDLRL